MKLTDISILVSERDLTDILMRFIANKNISIKFKCTFENTWSL